MPEPADPATPSRRPRPRRTRKFVLPEHHHDERADDRAAERIEAFIEGPASPPRQRPATDRDRHPIELETRQDWVNALQHECARHARYGRPASILLIGLTGSLHDLAVDRTARTIAKAIRAEARETDRAVRTGALSFRLLLPETSGRSARVLAERLDRAYLADPDGRSDGVVLAIEVATAPRLGTLEDALVEAERRLAARNGSS